MKAVEVLVKNLKNWGIKHAFSIPGKAIVPLLLELENQNIEVVLSKHEGGAGYAATGYSLVNSKIGLAIGTSGPGGTNLLTAAGQAKASNVPLLIITGHPAIKSTGTALGQDSTIFGTDLTKMFEPVTKFSAMIERADLLEIYLKHALELAYSGVKGPVHLSIPADVLLEDIVPFKFDLPKHIPMISNNLDNVIETIKKSDNPVLLLGKGIHSSSAYNEVRLFAEHFNIPVMTTPGGKGTFISNHELSLGPVGLGGVEASKEYLKQDVDLMIVMGTKLSDMSLVGFNKDIISKVIHFDYDQTFIGKSLKVDTLPILGDIKANLTEIIKKDNIKEKIKENNIEAYNLKKHKYKESNGFISARSVINTMSKLLPDNTIVFGDDGSHTFYGIKYYDVKKEGGFFFDDVFGAMGHAIGYSIGAKLARPDIPIVCLTGDGCLMMHGNEISTAVNHGANVIFIVLNNGRLDMVEKGMKNAIGRSVATVFENPIDVKKYAESIGATSFQCIDILSLEKSIKNALNLEKTVVIEAIVDPNEIPPTMERG